MSDLRYPDIQGKTEAEQLGQVKRYLHELVDQLNWALSTVESAQAGNTSAVVYQQKKPSTDQEAEDTFNSIKALIIKSADIVKAYEETILTNFNGKYFADSDFGTYLEETSRTVVENSKYVTETYNTVQSITNQKGDGTLDKLVADVRETNAYINRGHLYYDSNGNSVVGIEIGETTKDGAFLKYARFTSEKLSFHNVNGDEVAYIGAGTADKDNSNCLYILGKAVFLGNVQFGEYRVDTSDGLAFTWIS
jgi:hypothetical protein